MQITNPAGSGNTGAVAGSDPSGVVVPYNAPTSNDFEQVLRSITPPATAAAPAAATATPSAAASGATPGAAPSLNPLAAAAGANATGATTATTPYTGYAGYAGYAGAMPAMYVPVPLMMPMGMMPAAGSTAAVPTTTGSVAGAAPVVAGQPMAMVMMPLAMVPMGMMPMTGMPAAPVAPGATAPVTPGAASSAVASANAAAGAASGTLQAPIPGATPITQPFGPTSYTAEPAYDGYSHFHTGIDYGVPTGTHVGAAGAGRVVAAGWDSSGFGNRVIVNHGNGVQTLYGHLSQVDVTAGQTVQAGQELGLSGSTGNSSGPHLHFGVEKNGQWVDPAPYLSGTAGASTGAAATPTASLASTDGTATATTTAAVGGGAATGTTATTATTSLPDLIQQVAAQTGVPASLVSAVVQTESAGNPHAVSSAGAKGLMQLMDATAAEFGVTDVFDPRQNVTAGTKYLASLLRQFNGNQQLAIAAYNAGPGAVQQYGGIPPYAETQAYVQKVTALAQQNAARGAA